MNVHRVARASKVSRARDSVRCGTNNLPRAREAVGRAVADGTWLALAGVLALGQSVAAQSEPRSEHTLPLVTPASNRA